ncbi:hypothetical protein [Streptomyces axinellae]
MRGKASAMFLQLLESFGTFFGGLGALVAATTQFLTFLKKKKEEERGGGRGAATEPVGGGEESSDGWMIPLGVTAYLTTAL